MNVIIEKIKPEFTVCRIDDVSKANLKGEFCFLSVTDNEISLVCKTEDAPSQTVLREDGWRAFRIQGALDFSLIGILSGISSALAENDIGIFAVSTYDTDYILTKSENFEKALRVLENSGYKIVNQ